MLRTLSLFFLFALVPVQAAIYFAHNVSEDSGVHKYQKILERRFRFMLGGHSQQYAAMVAE